MMFHETVLLTVHHNWQRQHCAMQSEPKNRKLGLMRKRQTCPRDYKGTFWGVVITFPKTQKKSNLLVPKLNQANFRLS